MNRWLAADPLDLRSAFKVRSDIGGVALANREEEEEDIFVDPPVIQVPKTDWKKKHEDLVAKYKELLAKKREYQQIIERQMEMIRYMGEVGLRTGLKYDELDMISRTKLDMISRTM